MNLGDNTMSLGGGLDNPVNLYTALQSHFSFGRYRPAILRFFRMAGLSFTTVPMMLDHLALRPEESGH